MCAWRAVSSCFSLPYASLRYCTSLVSRSFRSAIWRLPPLSAWIVRTQGPYPGPRELFLHDAGSGALVTHEVRGGGDHRQRDDQDDSCHCVHLGQVLAVAE